MKDTWMKRVLAWLLCVVLLLGVLPLPSLAAEDGLVLHYDFESLTTGTIVNDVSGSGKAAEVMPRGSGVETKEVNIYGQTHTALVLQGGQPGTGHNYVELPAGVLNGVVDQ